MRRPVGRRATTFLVGASLLASTLVACSISGEQAATDGSGPTTSTSPGPGSGGSGGSTTTGPPTTSGSDTDATTDDVPDTVFTGLGDPRIDVSTYAVEVTADPGKPEIQGRVELELKATTDEPLESFTLDLRGPKVRARAVAGQPAEVIAGDAEITVTPATPLPPGADTRVVLRYAGQPDTPEFPGLGVDVGWQADRSDGWFTMSEPNGTATWVPVNDHPSDKATWTITLNTPDDATGVANGRLESSKEAGGRKRWVWQTRQPMASYLAFAAVGDYDLVQADGPKGVEITFAFPPSLSKEERSGFDELPAILDYYAKTFGTYPFDAAGAVVVTSTLGLALETQTRPLFGADAIGDGTVWALPHEVAHQWFGDAVSVERWEDLWLNEGFATYADWLYQSQRDGVSVLDVAEEQAIPTHGDYAVTDPEAAASFDGAIYQGGAMALHALRLTIGDDDFFTLIRQWFADHSGANATTEEFEALAEDVSGQDLDAFFDAWLHSPDQPEMPK